MQLKKVHEKESFGKHDTSIKSIFLHLNFQYGSKMNVEKEQKKYEKIYWKEFCEEKLKSAEFFIAILFRFFFNFNFSYSSLQCRYTRNTHTHTHSIRWRHIQSLHNFFYVFISRQWINISWNLLGKNGKTELIRHIIIVRTAQQSENVYDCADMQGTQ